MNTPSEWLEEHREYMRFLGWDNNELFRVQGTHEQACGTFFRPPNGRALETGVVSEPPMAAEEGSFGNRTTNSS